MLEKIYCIGYNLHLSRSRPELEPATMAFVSCSVMSPSFTNTWIPPIWNSAESANKKKLELSLLNTPTRALKERQTHGRTVLGDELVGLISTSNVNFLTPQVTNPNPKLPLKPQNNQMDGMNPIETKSVH